MLGQEQHEREHERHGCEQRIRAHPSHVRSQHRLIFAALQADATATDSYVMAITEPALDARPSTVAAVPPVPTVAMAGICRSFGDNPALLDLDLQVPAAKITVLLGPNGAGKTTAIRMITGALNPDAGSVRVFGQDPNVDGEDVRRRCGVVSAKPSLYDRLSGFDNLAYAAELYGLGRGDKAAGIIRASAARFGIDHALEQQAGGYSTGMKTRLALARSVLHSPDLLLFDEPTSGLDPESSYAVLELIREMTATGATVVMCTHLLLEAEGLADQVVVLEEGTRAHLRHARGADRALLAGRGRATRCRGPDGARPPCNR